MTPTRIMIIVAAVVLGAGCDWNRARKAETPAAAPGGTRDVGGPTKAPPDAPVPAKALPKQVQKIGDILVNGQESCALTVVYQEQPHEITWNGERCAALTISMASIEDLRMREQVEDLDADGLQYLNDMPNQQALYIEGQFTSTLYLENSLGKIVERPLAD